MSPTKHFRRRFVRAGAPPGTLTTSAESPKPSIHVMSYSATEFEEGPVADVAGLDAYMNPERRVWIDVQGLGDAPTLEAIRDRFGIHHLAMADVANIGQRPKVEAYGSHLFFVIRMVTLDADDSVQWEQVSVILGDGYVLTFQERPGDCLDPLRGRIRAGRPRIRAAGTGYLAVMVLDAIVDGYFPVLEAYGEHLEDLERLVIEAPTEDVLAEVFRAKRDLLSLRRAAWPLRDALTRLYAEGNDLIADEVSPYIRDALDHVMQVVDMTETYRELAGSFVDVYLSSVSNRTNEVMRVLTVIATIFIPLTFIAGIYGMNFEHMPELGWQYGYVVFWGVCAIAVIGLLVLFRRLGWLGGGSRH